MGGSRLYNVLFAVIHNIPVGGLLQDKPGLCFNGHIVHPLRPLLSPRIGSFIVRVRVCVCVCLCVCVCVCP